MRLSLDEGSARAQGQHGSGDAFDYALRLKQVNLMAGSGRRMCRLLLLRKSSCALAVSCDPRSVSLAIGPLEITSTGSEPSGWRLPSVSSNSRRNSRRHDNIDSGDIVVGSRLSQSRTSSQSRTG